MQDMWISLVGCKPPSTHDVMPASCAQCSKRGYAHLVELRKRCCCFTTLAYAWKRRIHNVVYTNTGGCAVLIDTKAAEVKVGDTCGRKPRSLREAWITSIKQCLRCAASAASLVICSELHQTASHMHLYKCVGSSSR